MYYTEEVIFRDQLTIYDINKYSYLLDHLIWDDKNNVSEIYFTNSGWKSKHFHASRNYTKEEFLKILELESKEAINGRKIKRNK